MILQFQEEIVFSEAIHIFLCNFLRFIIKATDNVTGNLSCETCRQTDQPLMIPFQCLEIHAGPVVIALRETDGHDLHQIAVAFIILCQKNQVEIPVFPVT